MSSIARGAGLLAVAALLVLGAAGLSGHLLDDEYCMSSRPSSEGEGTVGGLEHRWAPPGVECVFVEPTGTTTEGRTGSWLGFLAALLVSFGIVGAALRRRPDPPTWLRLSTATTLVFAIAGLGAIGGGWQGSVLLATALGIPVAFLADHWLRPARRVALPWTAGPAGAAVGFAALIVASTAWLFDLGLAGYGLTLLLVARISALPWSRALTKLTPWPTS